MKQKSLILSLLLLLVCSIGFSQSGKIAGKVIDGDFNDVLAFANIVIKDTSTGTTSDFDGNFQLEVEPGVYTVVFSYVGYETKELADVTVKSGQVTEVEVTLNTNSLDEVVVKTTVKRNTENAILNLQRKSSIVLDGLSAQSIKKTGASNVASAVKNVPGVSVQGGKYVYVRGLGDRYTKSILNGVDIPGLDPDRNTIPMDIFPTNIIDNVIVIKSAAAEYPADFTGGIVDVVTKDFPTKEEYSVSIGGGYNTKMHFNDKYLSYEGSDTDFFAYDDGTRNLPINRYQPIPGTFDNNILLTSLTDKFGKQLKADNDTSGMDYSIGFTAGNQYSLNEEGDKKLGYLASVSYKNNTRFFEERFDGNYIRNENNNADNQLLIDKTTSGSEGINEVLINALAGLTFKTKLSKYKFTGMHIQNGESSAGLYNQRIAEAGGGSGIINAVKDALLYTERSITNLALSGSHQLGATTDWKFDWKIAPSFSKVQDKDHRVTPLRVINNGNGSQDFIIDASSVDNPVRIWRNLLEENWVFKADFSKKYELFGKPAQLKVGGSYVYKFRDFNTDRYVFTATDAEKSVFNGDTNTLLLSQNIWNPTTDTGTYLDFNNEFDPANSYEGEQKVSAFYISNEFNVAKPLKLILGLRGEDFQLFYTGVLDDENVTRLKTIDAFELFPSANAIYALNDNSNIRASYSRTTARPSFKEASSASIFDPITNRIFIGGLDNGQTDPIKPSYINNFDLRYEWFREGGQMISLSGFYKDFKDPIETFFFQSAPDQLTVGNLGNAKVYGVEAEIRQNLKFISADLENLKFNANISVIESELEMSDSEYNRRVFASRVGETVDRKRELQGQSPFLVNVGLDYNNPDWGLQTGLFYNIQGKTLEVVGTGIVPDVYTQPFNSLNFTLNKTFGEEKRMAVDLKVKNILGDERESLYESYGASDQTFKFRDPGTEISLGLSYKF